MAETSVHRTAISELIGGMERYFAAVPDVWVGGDLLFFWEEGNPRAFVAPDVLVARGVRKWERPNYLLWQEVPPSLIVEVTSRSTRRVDFGKKRDLYERLGVEEYFLFDPYGEYLSPKLQGFCRVRGRYRELAPGRDGSLKSETTGLTFVPEDRLVRLVVTATGKRLLFSHELEGAVAELEGALAEEARARQEAERAREEAERSARALREELERLRRGGAGGSS